MVPAHFQLGCKYTTVELLSASSASDASAAVSNFSVTLLLVHWAATALVWRRSYIDLRQSAHGIDGDRSHVVRTPEYAKVVVRLELRVETWWKWSSSDWKPLPATRRE